MVRIGFSAEEEQTAKMLLEGKLTLNAKAKERMTCKHCGAEFNRGWKRNHERRPDCTAARNQKLATARGLVMIQKYSFAKAIVDAVDGTKLDAPLLQYLETEVVTSKKKKSISRQWWGPVWLSMFDVYSTSRDKLTNGGGSASEKEAAVLYAPIVLAAFNDPAKAAALQSIYDLGGCEGIATLIFTSKHKAMKLREEAAQLDARAAKLRAEALELDPVRAGEVEDA
jgi:outer membrane PBP1 activator LpoA protein